jgi:ectoine hydroxylase
MELTAAQKARFERDGFLIFPGLFAQNEVAVLRQEVARLSRIDAEEITREHTGGVKSIFRVHEEDGVTRSAPFRALVRTPRVLRPVQQVLGTDETYVYHTKINAKPAVEGTIWMWHQDYNYSSRA